MDEFELDLLLVADAAQAVGGKLYVVGGGWTHLWLPDFPMRPPIPFFVATGIRVPWNRTNQRFALSIDLQDADRNPVGDGPIAYGELEQGRPPGLTPGSDQRVILAAPVVSEFPVAGRYVFAVTVNERELGTTTIEVRKAEAAVQLA